MSRSGESRLMAGQLGSRLWPALIAIVAACQPGNLDSSTEELPLRLEVVFRGSADHAMVGEVLPGDLVVKVSQGERGVAGVAVVWTTSSGTVLPRSDTTDTGGHLKAQWTFGNVHGPVAATARIRDLPDQQVDFTSMAVRVARLEVDAPSTMIVNEMALFQVDARSDQGYHLPLPADLTWASSDPTVATVSSQGVVTAHDRGLATITVTGAGITQEMAVEIRARVRITPVLRFHQCWRCRSDQYAFFGPGPNSELGWRPALGDTLRFRVQLVDVDGNPLEENPPATWSSSHPEAVTVDDHGMLVARAGPATSGVTTARIRALTADGADSVLVSVNDRVIAGDPAMLRLAHAAVGVGPVTFVHNKGAPITLSYGQHVDLSITSGLFFLDSEGLPIPTRDSLPTFRTFGAQVRGGDMLAIYAVGNPRGGLLTGTWDRAVSVASDSVRVRMIQGNTTAGIVYLLPPGARTNGRPQLCYFDPPDSWGYTSFPAGGLDLVFQAKYGSQSTVRIGVDPGPGRSATYVITELATGNWGIMAFPEN